MGDHDITPTCLSAEEHGNNEARDVILHYLGCLEFCEREAYFNWLEGEHQKQLESELRRIEYLRHVLKHDKEESLLLVNLDRSMKSWRQCDLYTCSEGIEAVRTWRLAKGRRNFENQRDPRTSHLASSEYDPDRDLNAYLIRYVKSQAEEELKDPRFNGHFPNHKIAVSQLLNREEPSNPLAKGSQPEESINYFHFPANNMQWIQRAMARYYSEDIRYNGIPREIRDREWPKTTAILPPEFWEGQQNGSQSASVRARHLRPLCETVSSDPIQAEAASRNIVLFMPYLNWETDRKREKLSQALELQSGWHLKDEQQLESVQRRLRQHERGDLTIPFLSKKGKDITWPKDIRRSHSPARRASIELWRQWRQQLKEVPSRSSPFKKVKGRIIAGTEVGQVLFDAAVLHEAMTNFRDRMLIMKYLHNDPPLHPRRTLDRAYYWTLKTTKLRDRDQVVYRGTTVERDAWHRLQLKKGTKHSGPVTNALKNKDCDEGRFEWDCAERDEARRAVLLRDSQMDPSASTDPSPEEVIGIRCRNCRDHIRHVSRVVMVDQLWMWILDEQTIIACFPERYGIDEQDPSGVHKSIRTKIQSLQRGRIRTVFDLALIIVNECSNALFAQPRIQDLRPQIMDIFSKAIGELNNKKSIGFEHLWEWTVRLESLPKPGYIPANLSDFIIPFLNINKEGQLQREIRDIIDELDIMSHITSQQIDIIKQLKRRVSHILDPAGIWTDKLMTTPMSDFKNDHAKKHQDDYFWFVNAADELLGDIDVQIGKLNGLRKSAESVSTSLDHLLNLKQQQDSVFQTWQSAKQAEETMRQGHAIMIFTVMTIVFLPLGFIASIFGMNNKQISGDDMPMTLQTQFRFIFPISAAIICFALVIAFSDFVRRSTWIIYKYLFTLTAIKLGLYDKVYLGLDSRTRDLVRNLEFRITKLKEEIKGAKQKRKQETEAGDRVRRSGADSRMYGNASGLSVVSDSHYRPRSLRPGTTGSENEDRNIAIQMDNLRATNSPGMM